MRTAEQTNNDTADDAGKDARDDGQARSMCDAKAQRQGNKKDHDASKDVTTDGWGGTGCRNTGVHKWIAGGGRGTIQRLCKGRIGKVKHRIAGTGWWDICGICQSCLSS